LHLGVLRGEEVIFGEPRPLGRRLVQRAGISSGVVILSPWSCPTICLMVGILAS
jgi:hypothetical protein